MEQMENINHVTPSINDNDIDDDDNVNINSNNIQTTNDDDDLVIQESSSPKNKANDDDDDITTTTINNTNTHGNIITKDTSYNIDMLDYLLSYFYTEKPLNCVLSGYVSQIISHLLDINNKIITSYIYKNKEDLFKYLILHATNKSTAEILKLLMISENKYTDEYETLIESTRSNVITMIINSINTSNTNSNSTYALISILIDIIQKDSLMTKVISLALTNEHFIQNVTFTIPNDVDFDIKANYNEILNFLLALYTQYNTINKFKIKNEQLHQHIISFTNKIILHIITNFTSNSSFTTHSTYNNNAVIPVLHNYKITIIDLFTQIILLYSRAPVEPSFEDELIKTKFIETAFEYVIHYEWNNIYHNSFLELMKLLLNSADCFPTITKHLFETFNILQHIITTIQDKTLFDFVLTNNHIRRGYYAFYIAIAYKLNYLIEDNDKDHQGNFEFMNKTKYSYSPFGDFDGFGGNKKEDKSLLKNTIKANSLLKYKESNKDWSIFYMTYIGREVKLYEGKLCDEDKMKVNEDDELMRLSGEGNDNDNNNMDNNNNDDNGDDNPFDFGKIGEDSDGIDLFDFNTGDSERNAKHKSNPKMDFIFEDFEFEDEPAQHIQNVDDDNNRDNNNNMKSNNDEFEFPNDNDNVNIINDNHEENENTTSSSSSNYNDNIYWSIPLSSNELTNNKLLNEALQDLENE